MKKRLLCAVALCCLIATSSQAQTTYINEDFSTGFGTTPPLGWTAFIMPFTSNPLVDSFHFDNPGTRVLNAPITDPACIFDSDNLSNDGTAEEVIMISPTFNAAVATVVMLEFDHYFQGLVGSQVYVIVTDGVISDTVYTTTATTPNPESLVIDISATAAGKPSVNVIFAWTGDWSWYWIFDNVLVYSPAANDVGVIAIDAPTSGCGLSATENVTVRIKNFGGVAQGGFPVSYTINGGAPVTETPVTIIPPGDTATYTFTATADLSATGAYSFDAYTSLVTDADNANDSTLGVSVTHEAIISTFPYLEDFEAEPLCGTTCGDPCNLVGSWNNAGGDDMDWTTDEGGTGSGGTGPSADNTTGLATGNYMYTESSGACSPGSEARLVSPCIDVTSLTSPTLSFFYHMAGANIGDLFVEVDSGAGYLIVDAISGPQQTIETDPWLEQIVPLTGYTGIINIRFRGVTGAGFTSDIAIDDISIFQPPLIDVGVIAITTPVSGCGLSATETITVEVVNFGSAAVDTIPVAYTIDGGAPVIDTIFATILVGDTATLSFGTTADLSGIATYIFDSWTQITGDGNILNDSTVGYTVTNTPLISTFPYAEGFETGNGGWASAGTNSSWTFGTPASVFIPAAANGINAWVTNLIGDYNNLEVSYLVSPCLDFTALATDPILNFSHIFSTEACCDEGWVEYSTNAGASWVKLGTAASGTNWYNDGINDWWDGNSGGAGVWRTAQDTLTGLAGQDSVRIRFAFSTDGSITDDGFGVDDVNIFEVPATDVGVIAITTPISGCGLSATETITVQVVNFGLDSLDTIPVTYTIDGGAPVIDTIFATILVGDTATFSFGTTGDFSAVATYIIDSWTQFPGDPNATNDSTLGVSVTHEAIISTFPYLEDFEAEPLCGTNCGDPCNLVGSWNNAGGDDMDWTSDEGGTPSAGTGPSADNTTGLATGNYMYTESSGACSPGSEARLVSPCIDVTSLTSPTLSFFYHMAGANIGDLFVEVDSGAGYLIVDAISGPQQTIETDPWIQRIVALTGYTGIINIRFRGVTGTGFTSDIAVDDISVFQPPTIDAGVAAILAPLDGCGLTTTESVQVSVTNYGSTAIDTIPVQYSVDGGAAVTDTVFATILPGDTVLLTFSTPADLSITGTYIIDAWTLFVGDAVAANDSSLGFTVTNNPIINVFPYLEDFEAEPLCGTVCGNPCNLVGSWNNAGGDDMDWSSDEGGTPSLATGPAVDNTTGLATGNYMYTESSGACNPGSEARLVSPCIDVTSLTSPTLSFFYHMAGADIGDLFVEVDSGAGYLIVDAISGPQQAAETDPWIQRIVALTGYTGIINIRFRGVTGAGFTSDMAIDDISVFQPPPNDVGVTSIMAPISGCGLTTTETITVQVVNFGTLAVDTIPVAYTIDGGAPIIDTIFATLLSGDTTTLSFTTPGDLSATATFILDSWTQFPGDGNNANDSTLGVAVTNVGPSISTFPYTEDFESGTLGQFTTSNVITALTWNNSTIRGTDPGHSNIRSAYFGNPADTSFSTGVVEGADLTLSCVDFSLLTDVRMSFNYFLETEALVGFDMAQVMVSTDGVAFTAIADNQGIANLVDPSGTWQNLDLDLTAYAGNPTVYVRFSFNSIDDINNTFEGFYIDDINIYVPPSADLGVIAVDAPNSGCVLTATETVTVQVFNYGTAAQDTFQVVYSLDGGPAVTDTIFATILPGDTAVFSFAVPADLSTAGLHTFDVWTNLVGDGNNANDSTVNYQVTHGVPVTVYPHFEDFEPEALCVTTCGAACPLAGNWSNDPTDAIDWTANEGTTGSGGTGPTVDQTTGLATGNYLYTEASGGCNPGVTASLLSSCLDISALSAPTVSYWYHMFGADMGTLYVEVNNGVSWVSVDSIVGEVQTADTDPWIGDSVDLSAFSGIIQIRFRAVTGVDFTSDLAIDDITVFDNVPPGDDVGVVSITSLASHCEDGTTETITIQVVNLGTVTADTIPVGYSVNGGTAELDTIFVTLLVGDTATFSFAVGTVMSPAGAYSVDAWTSYVGDVNSVNDSSNVGISIFANPAVALGADTSICVGTSVTLNTSNFGFASYLWSTGATDSTITTFLPAAYVLTVTDGNGCTGTDSIVVSLNPDLVLTMSKTDASCGGSDGTATVAVTGGTGPYNYLWNDPGAQTNDTATALAAASYSVIVTDAIGCTDSATVSVNNVGGPTVVASQISGVSCFGGSDGGVTVSVTGGTSPFTYLWDDPGAQTNDTATGLTATMVTVTVTDNAGCIATDNVTPTEPAVLALTTSSVNSNCGQSDGSASVVVTGGTGVYTYLWDDPSAQTTATAGNIPAATYKVIVSDANACTDSANVIVTDIAGGIASIASSTNASCNGVCDGNATAAIAGGTAPFVYSWDDPGVQSNALAVTLCAGTFNVTITDINGCSDSSSVTITEPVAITLTTASVDATCGNPDGSASVAASGGTSPFTYLWNDPGAQTNDTATGLVAGAYLVIVTDAIGCLDSNVATVNNTGGPSATITSSTNVLCNGAATGSATVSATGGTLPYTYLWSDPSAQTDSTATGLAAGLYTVTVTDGNVCISTDFVTLTEPLTISSSTSSTDESCVGSCNGSASVIAGGGTGAFVYLWDDPGAQTNATATGLCATTHTVIITDGNGCTQVNSATVNSGAGFTSSTSSIDATCGNADGSATVSITGGTAPFTYLWDDPSAQTNASAVGLAVGTYIVVVTDANGCSDSQSATVNNIGGPTATIVSSTNVLCNAGTDGAATAAGTGGTGPYTYLWDDPALQTTATATGLSAGSYSIDITDSLGCTGTALVTISEPTALVSTSTKTDASCNGVCDGSATISTSGGTAPYGYLWDDPLAQTNATAVGLCAGTVTVIVTDNNGCIDGGTETLTEPVAINLTTSVVDANCGGSDGSITVTASLGTPPYNYSWNDPGSQTTATASSLPAGTWTCTVTDANGCTNTVSATVADLSGAIVTTSGTNATCLGCLDGTATATATGGITPYTYLWDDPGAQTNATATGLGAGTYNVIVTDASGCLDFGSVIITEPTSTEFTLTVNTTNVVCNDACDGTATAIVQNGTAPFTYSWNDPLLQTTQVATGLCNGTYNITVTDDTGAVRMATITIFQPSAIEITPIVTGATCGSSDGSITLNVSGGTPGYLYLWSTGSTTAVENGLATGTYSVTVTDANACTGVRSISVGNANGPIVTVSNTNISCSGASDGTATATVTGGTLPYNYLWDDLGAQTSATAIGLPAGSYTVMVTDASGCVNTSSSVTVTEPLALSATASMFDATGALCNGQASVLTSGGTPPYTYSWSDPTNQTTMIAVSLCPGLVTATVEDANGCTVSDGVTVGSITGIWEHTAETGFVLYPNPTTGMVWIEQKGSASDPLGIGWDLIVYDFTGKVVLTKNRITDSSIIINLDELPSGIYLAKITSSNGAISTSKIILE